MISDFRNEFPFQVDEFYLELQIDGSKISSLTEEEVSSHPFPGLRPFKTSEFQLFKGRDGQSEELINRLKNNHFLAVIGSSGTGKSSLIRAGLIPQLLGGYLDTKQTKWNIAICRPGKNPIQNLAVALSFIKTSNTKEKSIIKNFEMISSIIDENIYGILDVKEVLNEDKETPNLLVIVDQFEEIFRFDRKELNQPNIESNFVNLLLKASANINVPIYVIITMRSEFLGDCIRFKGLPEAINQGQYLVPQLRRNQIKDVIEGPIKLAGKQIDHKLVELLLNELERKTLKENLDQLPILQHALMSTYSNAMEEGQQTIIGIEHYKSKEIGGMELALANHAESKYFQLGESEHDDNNPSIKQKIAKIVFQSLTELGSDLKGGRRPIELKYIHKLAFELFKVSSLEVNQVIDQFRDEYTSFIMPPNNTPLYKDLMLDISHESLMRNWERLKKWIQEEFDSAKNYERLVENTSLYKKTKKGLLEGKELENTLEPNEVWAERYDKNFARKQYNVSYEEAKKYLEDSKTYALEKIQKAKDIEEAERKKKLNIKILKYSVLILPILFFIFYISMQIKLHSYIVFNRNAHEIVSEDPTKAINLMWQTYNHDSFYLYKEDIERLFHREAFYSTLLNFSNLIPEDSVTNSSKENYIEKNSFSSFAISKSGKFFVTGNNNGELDIWYNDSFACKKIKGINQESFNRDTDRKIYSVVISDDEKYILTGSLGGARLYNFNFKEKKLSKPIELVQSGKITELAISKISNNILTGSSDGSLNFYYHLKNGNNYDTQVLVKQNHGKSQITCVAFSNNEEHIVVGSNDYKLKYFKTEGISKNKLNFNTESELFNEQVTVTAIVFTPDDKKIILGCTGGNLIYKNVNSFINKPLRTLTKNNDTLYNFFTGHNQINSIAFFKDSSHVIIGSSDNTASIIDLDDFSSITLKGHTSPVIAVGYAVFENKDKIITFSADNSIRSWICYNENSIISDFYKPNSVIKSAIYSESENTVVAAISPKDSRSTKWEIYKYCQGNTMQKPFIFDNKTNQSKLKGNTDKKKSKNENEIENSHANYPPKNTIIISPSGKKFLTINVDNTVDFGYIIGDKIIVTDANHSTGHQGIILSAKFSPDENSVLTYSNDKTAKLWHISNENKLDVLLGNFCHNSPVVTASVSEINKKVFVITGTLDGMIDLWIFDANKKFLKPYTKRQDSLSIGKGNKVVVVALSADSKSFMIGGDDKIIRTGIISSLKFKLDSKQIQQNDKIVYAAASSDGHKFVTAHLSGIIKVWKVDNNQNEKLKLSENIGNLFNSIKDYLFNNDKDLIKKPLTVFQVGDGHSIINSLAFCNKNNFLLCCYDNKARLLKIDTTDVITRLNLSEIDNSH